MAKTSYKSSAQKATDAAVIPGARAPAPPELEPEAVPLWVEIVNRLPAEWVVSENKVLPGSIARRHDLRRAFARIIAGGCGAGWTFLQRCRESGPGALLKWSRLRRKKLHELHRIHGFETDRAGDAGDQDALHPAVEIFPGQGRGAFAAVSAGRPAAVAGLG